MAQILVTDASDVLGKRITRELSRRGHSTVTSPAKKHDTLIICGETTVQETKDLVNEAKRAKLKHIIFVSSLGASPHTTNQYLVTKYEEELIVKQSNIPYTIFRPGVVISKARFVLRFPIPEFLAGRGVQPTYLCNLARSMVVAVDTQPKNAVHEIFGPEKLALRELLSLVKKSLKLHFK